VRRPVLRAGHLSGVRERYFLNLRPTGAVSRVITIKIYSDVSRRAQATEVAIEAIACAVCLTSDGIVDDPFTHLGYR